MTEKLIVIFNGPRAVGKSYLSEKIVNLFNAKKISMSKLLLHEANKHNMLTTDFVEDILKNSPELKVKIILNPIIEILKKNNVLCIESVYNQDEIDFLKKFIAEKYKHSKVISVYLDSKLDTLKKRLMVREHISEKEALLNLILVNLGRHKLGMNSIKYDIIHQHENNNDSNKIITKIFKNKRRLRL